MGVRVHGLEFRVQGLVVRVEGLGFHANSTPICVEMNDFRKKGQPERKGNLTLYWGFKYKLLQVHSFKEQAKAPKTKLPNRSHVQIWP